MAVYTVCFKVNTTKNEYKWQLLLELKGLLYQVKDR
jgi:hypothetical protein